MKWEWTRTSGIIWEDFGGTIVLVCPLSKQTFVLNETASHVWKTCDWRISINDLASQFACATAQELREVRIDLLNFVHELRHCKLIVREMITHSKTPSIGQCCFAGKYVPPAIRLHISGAGFRGRPSSRGISGPG